MRHDPRHPGGKVMKVILDRVSPALYSTALKCVERYHIEYMFDGRKHGIRNGVIFSANPEPALCVYHTKAGNITVRQGT